MRPKARRVWRRWAAHDWFGGDAHPVNRGMLAATLVGLLIPLGACLGLSEGAAASLPRASSGLPALPGDLAATGCTTASASAPALMPRTSFVSLAGPPFGIAVTPDGRWSFVDETSNGQLAVLSTRVFRPRLVRTIRVAPGVQGNSLTPDGRYLLLADGGNGATVVSVKRAESGARRAVLGSLSQSGDRGPGGAIEVVSSPDGRYVFVSVEYEARIAVYDLHVALSNQFSTSSTSAPSPWASWLTGWPSHRTGAGCMPPARPAPSP